MSLSSGRADGTTDAGLRVGICAGCGGFGGGFGGELREVKVSLRRTILRSTGEPEDVRLTWRGGRKWREKGRISLSLLFGADIV